jgi:hypothetical protein
VKDAGRKQLVFYKVLPWNLNVDVEKKGMNFRGVGLHSDNELEESQHNKQNVT